MTRILEKKKLFVGVAVAPFDRGLSRQVSSCHVMISSTAF